MNRILPISRTLVQPGRGMRHHPDDIQKNPITGHAVGKPNLLQNTIRRARMPAHFWQTSHIPVLFSRACPVAGMADRLPEEGIDVVGFTVSGTERTSQDSRADSSEL